jgi:hypothetical protein
LARLLAITAGILLVIACANLGGLLLARGTARAKEIAMRISLGASRLRILRQLLTESILLAALGGILGLLLSRWTSQLLMGFYRRDAEGYGRFYDLRLDPQVVIFAAAVSLTAGVLFGLLPALLTSRDTGDALRSSGAGSGVRSRLRAVLVAAQVALSLTLLVGAGLLARSGLNLENQSSFDVHHVVAARTAPALDELSAGQSTSLPSRSCESAERNRRSRVRHVLPAAWAWFGDPVVRTRCRFPADMPDDPQRPSRVSYPGGCSAVL